METESIGDDIWCNFHLPVWKLANIFRISVLFAIWTANFPDLQPKSAYFFNIICQISDLGRKSTYFFNESNQNKKYAKFGYKSRKLTIYIKEEYCKNTNNRYWIFYVFFEKVVFSEKKLKNCFEGLKSVLKGRDYLATKMNIFFTRNDVTNIFSSNNFFEKVTFSEKIVKKIKYWKFGNNFKKLMILIKNFQKIR